MKEFGDLLQQFIIEQYQSVSSFSKLSGINRGQLYRIFSGEKNMSESSFSDMLDSNFFTDIQNEELTQAYYSKKYPEDVFERITYIIEAMSALSQPESNNAPVRDFKPKDKIKSIVGMCDISAAAEYVLCTAAENKDKSVYTNYPFKLQNLDAQIYSYLKQNPSSVDFNHIVCLDTIGKTNENLQSVFAAMRYARSGLIPYCYYSDYKPEKDAAALYPYYFTSASCSLLFDSEGNSGIIISDADTASTMTLSARQAMTVCEPMAATFKNELELKQLVSQYAFGTKSVEKFYGLSYYPCILPYMDLSDFDAIGRRDVPGRDTLIQISYQHYSSILQFMHSLIFTKEGLKEFAETGKIPHMTHNLITDASPELRCKILKKLSDEKRLMLDESKLRLPSFLDIEIRQSALFFGLTADKENSFIGEVTMIVKDKHIIGDFNYLFDYLIRGRFCYSDGYTKGFINDLAMKCSDDKIEL